VRFEPGDRVELFGYLPPPGWIDPGKPIRLDDPQWGIKRIVCDRGTIIKRLDGQLHRYEVLIDGETKPSPRLAADLGPLNALDRIVEGTRGA